MDSIEYGAHQAVHNCMHLQPGEKIVIITDNHTKHIAQALAHQADQVSPGNTTIFIMEDFGPRPDDGINPLQFPQTIADAITTSHVSFYAAECKKGELQSFRSPMIQAIEKNPQLRHAHMPKITDTLMAMGMASDYKKIQQICADVANTVQGATHAHVTTPAGTDLIVTLDPNFKWIICDGSIEPGNWSNLPDGEVFTCAKSTDGTIVVDGVLGDYFSEQFGLIEKTPVTIKVKEGRVTSISCLNPTLKDELKRYMKQDENANRIGEFAIGTNIGLTHLVGNLLQDEKFPGVHVAIGHGYPKKTGSDWDSVAHLDAVLKKTTITINEKQIMKNGTFTI